LFYGFQRVYRNLSNRHRTSERAMANQCESLWGSGLSERQARLATVSVFGDGWGSMERLGPSRHSVAPNSPAICAFWSHQNGKYPMSTHREPQIFSANQANVPKSTPRVPQRVSATSPYPLGRSYLSRCRQTLFWQINSSISQVFYLKVSRQLDRCGASFCDLTVSQYQDKMR
jgi:hypothetical protein